MNKAELLRDIDYEVIYGNVPDNIESITEHMDTRKITPGDAYVCITGARFDSHDKVVEILEAGAKLVFVSGTKKTEILTKIQDAGITPDAAVLAVEDVRLTKATLMNNWYDHPATKMTMIGLTGSKGKTTTTNMIASILRSAGHNVGTIGSTGAVYADKCIELANSTPDSEDIQKYLADMVACGCDCAVVECSSQGLMQHRASGFVFDYGVFMNIVEGDHVAPNEHTSFEDYLRCKSYLFLQSKVRIVNANTEHLEELMTLLHSYGIYDTMFFADEITDRVKKMQMGIGLTGQETLCEVASEVNEVADRFRPQIHMTVSGVGMNKERIHVNFPGLYQVTNALAAISVCAQMGIAPEVVDEALSNVTVKGRLEMVYQSEKFSVCVDFAHNGFSTRSLLKSLRAYQPKRLVCIFGADGNRARSRRYEMGEASGNLADLSIVTSGHNRYETFEAIFEDIKVGLQKTTGDYVVIPNRKEAIQYAIQNVQDGDLITIIGLGQETYQEENGVKYPYSDTEYVLQTIKEYMGK